MVDIIKQFFDKYIKPPSVNQSEVSEHSIQLATAALLVEMMRADHEITDDERETITGTTRSKFSLTDDETAALMKLAEEKIWHSTGYFEFTSMINKCLSQNQKVSIIEHLWEVAYADSILDKHEEYMARKIADLIYVPHKDFIDAKLRVRDRLQTTD